MVGDYLSKKSRSISRNSKSAVIIVRNTGIAYVAYRVSKAVIGIPVGAVAGLLTASPITYAVVKNVVGFPVGVITGVLTFKALSS